jgi:hypothetical protein
VGSRTVLTGVDDVEVFLELYVSHISELVNSLDVSLAWVAIVQDDLV